MFIAYYGTAEQALEIIRSPSREHYWFLKIISEKFNS